jgi:hypothetical protein
VIVLPLHPIFETRTRPLVAHAEQYSDAQQKTQTHERRELPPEKKWSIRVPERRKKSLRKLRCSMGDFVCAILESGDIDRDRDRSRKIDVVENSGISFICFKPASGLEPLTC